MGAALKAAGLALYQHSIRLVPLNLAWGLGLLVVLGIGLLGNPVVGLLLAPVLGLPLIGLARLAGHLARGRDVVLSDATQAIRSRGGAALVTAAGFVAAAAILGANLAGGILAGGPPGWALATLAGWGLLMLALAGFPFWALLGDPARAAWRVRDVARLTGLLVLAVPGRLALLAIALAAIVTIGTLLLAAILTLGVAYASLATAFAVLPTADRLTARLGGLPPLAEEPDTVGGVNGAPGSRPAGQVGEPIIEA